MLQIAPTHWYSWNFTVTDESRRVADIATGWLRETGTLIIEAASYRVYREAWIPAPSLEQAGRVLARAEKPGIFRREFVVRHADRQYRLVPQSFFRRTVVLLDGSRRVGSIAPEGAFTRKATADLPHALPLPVRMFIVWLTVISWRRQQNS